MITQNAAREPKIDTNEKPMSNEVKVKKRRGRPRKNDINQSKDNSHPITDVKTVNDAKETISETKLNNNFLCDCLERLNNNNGSIPLPGREDKVEQINEFINNVFTEKKYRALFISGSPGTGKTATVKQCIKMAESKKNILFVNCKTDPQPKIFEGMRNKPRLLILDEIESLSHFKEVINNCKILDISIIGISNAHDETIAVTQYGQTDTQSIMFNSYTTDQLKEILVERIGGLCKNISLEALSFVAKKIGRDHGDARAVISTLTYIITEAISTGIKTLDLRTTIKLLETQNTSNESDEILKEIPIIEQIALIAIYKNPSNSWRDTLNNLLCQKHIKENINPIDIFDRLNSYGLVGGSAKNPRCKLSDSQIKTGLDPIAVSLL